MNVLLRRLLERLDFGHVDVSGEGVDVWPDGVGDALETAGFLVRATNARGVSCDGCEDECWVVPDLRRSPSGATHWVHA